MLSEFITYIQEHQLFRLSRDRILLAVSGGMDSIALVQLCKKAGVKFGIAHCNFQLRGKESDGDAAFVEQLASDFGVPFYSVNFDTQKIADEKKASIQLVARQLRYRWLEQIQQENDYNYIAVAHHHNDSIETLLMNLTVGCGIRGLHGIYPKNGSIIRPLLFASKADITNYINSKNFKYREDSSNADTKYRRNAVRHLVVPALENINPELGATFHKNFARFRATEALYNYAIEQLKAQYVQYTDNTVCISIKGVEQAPSPQTFLYEVLTPYNFKASKIEFIYRRREEPSGSIYTSKTHRLLRDREHWIVIPTPQNLEQAYTIDAFNEKSGTVKFDHLMIDWKIHKNSPTFQFDEASAYFDLKTVQFPLHLRRWKAGDIFHPIGMNGKKKKLSKFFKDIKLNRFEKDATWLLCNREQAILWVVQHRADERFRVTSSTEQILELKIQEL